MPTMMVREFTRNHANMHPLSSQRNRRLMNRREYYRRMLKKTVQQSRSSKADPRFTFHASRFTVLGSAARTPLADFFSILLEFRVLPAYYARVGPYSIGSMNRHICKGLRIVPMPRCNCPYQKMLENASLQTFFGLSRLITPHGLPLS